MVRRPLSSSIHLELNAAYRFTELSIFRTAAPRFFAGKNHGRIRGWVTERKAGEVTNCFSFTDNWLRTNQAPCGYLGQSDWPLFDGISILHLDNTA